MGKVHDIRESGRITLEDTTGCPPIRDEEIYLALSIILRAGREICDDCQRPLLLNGDIIALNPMAMADDNHAALRTLFCACPNPGE